MKLQHDPIGLEILLTRHTRDARTYEAFCVASLDHGGVPEDQISYWKQAEAASFRAVLQHTAKSVGELRAQLRHILENDDEDRMRDSLETLAWQPIDAELDQAVQRLVG